MNTIDSDPVSLAHLEHLHDTLDVSEADSPTDELHFWWIYAEPERYPEEGPPDSSSPFRPFPANNEGISCVDDVARIAVAYLRHHDLTGSETSRQRARQALEFVLFMQREEDGFLNFVTDPERNEGIFGERDPDVTRGVFVDDFPEEQRSIGWWVSRALWALAEGYEAFLDDDPAFAERLEAAIEATIDRWVEGPLERYGEYTEVADREVATWLLADETPPTAPAVLGLATYARTTGDDRARECLRKFAEGLHSHRFGHAWAYPFGADVYSTESQLQWHSWGARQAAALARAGDVLGEPEFVESARGEVCSLFSHQLAGHTLFRGFSPVPKLYPQISFGAESMVQGCTELWRATGERTFATMGALFASWYFGNNVAGKRMYDPETGRGFDGIYQETVDWKAGAESTVCAVLSMLSVAEYPGEIARLCRHGVPVDSRSFEVLEAEGASCSGGATILEEWDAQFSQGTHLFIFVDGEATLSAPELPNGPYVPYVVHRRQDIPTEAYLRFETDADTHELPMGGAGEPRLWMDHIDPITIPEASTLRVTYDGPPDKAGEIDAIVLQPGVEYRSARTRAGDSAVAIARSFLTEPHSVSLPCPIEEHERPVTVTIRSFDTAGSLLVEETLRNVTSDDVSITVPPFGFVVVRLGGNGAVDSE